ncbi:hypothetical protein ACFPL7_11050 [Dongia soli]|uniref:Uncharacterized protein n=1 Tax=Dongia soli TaxID=600628 RepID=A0ABU5EB35_9PROT|nr:hypothetical protein [Dongia soli]MDY0883487.1 hypothetical protein [Dongia soli]
MNLPPQQDISERQWAVLEPQLAAATARLSARVKRATDQLLPHIDDGRATRRLNAALGQIELDLSRAFLFFDTYMDVLTQRNSAELGAILRGCDALAMDAMRRDHPALGIIEPPLVYCDRGFGASIVRESVPFPDTSPNPMPLLQIPYGRLKEKHNLTSILHESGHQALARLQLVSALADTLRDALARAGAPEQIRHLYALWSFEIGPDFWAFALSGIAEAAAIRDLFALPSGHALRVSYHDPHPPPYLRALLTFDWCRRAWGQGAWDDWERQWLAAYPLDAAPTETRRVLLQARRFIPVVGQTLFDTRFRVLGRRRLLDLFDLAPLAPNELKRRASGIRGGKLDLTGLAPSVQLAVFRMVREWYPIGEAQLDRLMSDWLMRLGRSYRHSL